MQGRTNVITTACAVTDKISSYMSSMPIDFGVMVIDNPIGSGNDASGMIAPSENNFVSIVTINYDMGFFPFDLTFIEE